MSKSNSDLEVDYNVVQVEEGKRIRLKGCEWLKRSLRKKSSSGYFVRSRVQDEDPLGLLMESTKSHDLNMYVRINK